MKLKTNNAAKKPINNKKNKSPKKQAKGVEIRKENTKEVVKPSVLKKEAAKSGVESAPSPKKILQQELWNKAIINVSTQTDLSDVESSIVKLLADYKTKSSIPLRSSKFINFITKGFSKYKSTDEETLTGVYEKLFKEFKSLGGSAENADKSKKNDKKTTKTISTKNTKMEVEEEEDDEDEAEDDGDELEDDDVDEDDVGSIELDNSDDDIDEESEEEKPKPKAKNNKPNNKNGKNSPNKGKNGSKFKGGKVQKNKKFGKKK